ncbi:hypothetical protein Y032_0233g3079 [Ancylostoma ceylanicum]|uniref:Uncharacterized protein n=1 Tax=Ancylostoma ceylanicum TaxID=53326 RepID=A0A016SF07_9BILA|nr:hypothetical protein Y032_0233g3079 [Ancylostoma ceylanicum]
MIRLLRRVKTHKPTKSELEAGVNVRQGKKRVGIYRFSTPYRSSSPNKVLSDSGKLRSKREPTSVFRNHRRFVTSVCSSDACLMNVMPILAILHTEVFPDFANTVAIATITSDRGGRYYILRSPHGYGK